MSALIEFKGFNKFFGEQQVLNGIDLHVKPGEVIVTHEMAFARAVADRIVFMDAGRILEQNPPEIFFTNPQTARAQQFLEKFSYVAALPKTTQTKELELL